MAITSTTAKAAYAGNGSATAFPTTFKFLENEHVVCVLTNTDGEDTVLELDTDYAVAGAGNDEGGTVSFPAAGSTYPILAAGETLTVYREVPLTQETDWENSDEIDVEEIEAADDKLTMLCQQIDAKAGRAIKVPVSSELSEVECESPEAGKALIWNDAGTGIVNGTIDTSTLSATTRREEFTAEAGQTFFELSTFAYTPSADNLAVYVDGLRLDASAYEKTSIRSFTLAAGATEGAKIVAVSVDIAAMADMNAATNAAEAAQAATEIQAAAANGSAEAAARSEENAALSESNAAASESNAAASAEDASTSKTDAAASATLSRAWSEGTEPGGAGSKSAKEWAETAAVNAQTSMASLGFLPVDPVLPSDLSIVSDSIAFGNIDLNGYTLTCNATLRVADIP
jgi:hypothetical protein